MVLADVYADTGVATPSVAIPSNSSSVEVVRDVDSESDLLALLIDLLDGSPSVSSEEQVDVPDPDGVELSVTAYDGGIPSLFALSGDSFVSNAVRYDVVVDGVPYVLLLPSDSLGQMYIDDDGLLWNVGSATVTGRIFDSAFDPTASDGDIAYFTSCLGNNFSNNYTYGSPNYIRHYYVSSGRVTYDTEYTVFLVEDSPFPFREDDILKYITIMILGGVLICLLRKSLR